MMKYKSELLLTLVQKFNDEELRTFCFHLNVDYDSLIGTGKEGKARELITFLERRNRFFDILNTGKRIRPDISWDSLNEQSLSITSTPKANDNAAISFEKFLESKPDKRMIYDYFKSNADILRKRFGGDKILSNISFGTNSVDFAIGEHQTTTGVWEWVLVILGLPSQQMFRLNGEISPELNQAIQKATEWRKEINSDLQKARSYLTDIPRNPAITIFIGRRITIRESDRQQLKMLKITMPGIVISTYDSIIESLQKV